jgi:hypothetical protein
MTASVTFSGGSEGIDQLTFRRGPKATAGPQGVAAHDEIHRTAKNSGQFALDAADLERAEQRLPARGPFVKIDHRIDVAFRRGRVARDRAEEIGMHHPESGEALAVLTQTSQGFIAAHGLFYQETDMPVMG